MIKFVSYMHKGKLSIYECEVKVVVPRPFVLNNFNEELYEVISPKPFKGERWFSFFFSNTIKEELLKVEKQIRIEFERSQQEYCEYDIQNKLSNIPIFIL
jgi:hypothetical protein